MSRGVGFRHPVVILLVSFRAMSTCLACADLYRTGHAYSPAEWQRASAEVLRTLGFAPQFELVNTDDIISSADFQFSIEAMPFVGQGPV